MRCGGAGDALQEVVLGLANTSRGRYDPAAIFTTPGQEVVDGAR